MKKKITLIIMLISFSIAGLILYKLYVSYQKNNQTETQKKEHILQIPVTVATVKDEIQKAGSTKIGFIVPFEEAKVISAGTGNIKELLFKLGDKVHKGQPLAIINTQLLELELKKSESNVAKLGKDLKTYIELLQGNAAIQRDVDALRQSYNDAKNQSMQLRKQISDGVIKSPIDGVISTKNVEDGMFVGSGGELASIISFSKLKVQILLTQSEIYNIYLGQKIKLSTDIYSGKSFWGKVTYISSQATEAFNFPVEITAGLDKNSPLLSGTMIYANFSKESTKKMLMIPRVAINESVLNASVYVVKNGKSILRKISVGEQFGDDIEVTQGLNAGEQVVLSGQINLQNGALVKIIKHNQ
ncbi:efflux RND transporter periplasmic adaptor subunit [Chryseobacterium sp. JV274]|uniref:efflux RND transporter periplasmic adaptor subunit n=1 Tax=Chryseobacterium sp. JV274 TaxID=1932669 RepID=UPI0015C1F989|nr:efflux RND transporter periplasmic adaptor subunit [Chryseobacterium sp. JV274]CAD0218261.1 Efflux transporter periplasmic adaptor subunit [Chryseobacterium sp. JV274]